MDNSTLNSKEVADYLAGLFRNEYSNYNFYTKVNYLFNWEVVAIGKCGDFSVASYPRRDFEAIGWRIITKNGVAYIGLENEEEIVEIIRQSDLTKKWLGLNGT